MCSRRLFVEVEKCIDVVQRVRLMQAWMCKAKEIYFKVPLVDMTSCKHNKKAANII